MFVRFRTTPRRLQVSILEARRSARKVTNEHIASLASIPVPMTVAERQAFWARLWERLATLSNRVGADDQAKIRNAVHARIPMVMPDEANADEAEYWARWGGSFADHGARKREHAAALIAEAEIEEGVAAAFADNCAAALRGERPMDRIVVGDLLAAKVGKPPPEGTPCFRANGEAAVVRYAKRPGRNDRRRRRHGVRYTPKAAEGWLP
jgi:hypothetical protein